MLLTIGCSPSRIKTRWINLPLINGQHPDALTLERSIRDKGISIVIGLVGYDDPWSCTILGLLATLTSRFDDRVFIGLVPWTPNCYKPLAGAQSNYVQISYDQKGVNYAWNVIIEGILRQNEMTDVMILDEDDDDSIIRFGQGPRQTNTIATLTMLSHINVRYRLLRSSQDVYGIPNGPKDLADDPPFRPQHAILSPSMTLERTLAHVEVGLTINSKKLIPMS